MLLLFAFILSSFVYWRSILTFKQYDIYSGMRIPIPSIYYFRGLIYSGIANIIHRFLIVFWYHASVRNTNIIHRFQIVLYGTLVSATVYSKYD